MVYFVAGFGPFCGDVWYPFSGAYWYALSYHLQLTAATLTIGLTVPAAAAEAPNEPIRVSSYKGSTLEVGERSGLIIGPSGIDYTVTSSDPDTVAVEQVLTFWVAVAKGSGTAEITASNRCV